MESSATNGNGLSGQGAITNQGNIPGFGAGRPTFGLVKDQGKRLEISLALRNGGMLTVTEDLADDLNEGRVKEFSEQLAKDVAGGATRTFSDTWNASGQQAWVNLGEVVAFSVRPAK